MNIQFYNIKYTPIKSPLKNEPKDKPVKNNKSDKITSLPSVYYQDLVVSEDISFGSKRSFKKKFKKCAYSGEEFNRKEKSEKKTIEHIVPLSRGGKNYFGNYLVIKSKWNEYRSSKTLKEFVAEKPEVLDNIKETVKEHEGLIIDGIDWAEEVKKAINIEMGENVFT